MLKWAVLAIVFLIAVAIVLLNSFIGSRAFVEIVERKAGELSPFAFDIGSIELSGLSSISLNDVAIVEKGTEVPLVILKSVEAGFSIAGLFKGEVESVSMEGLEVTLDFTTKPDKKESPASNSIYRSTPTVPLIIGQVTLDETMIKLKHLKENGEEGLVEIGPVHISLATRRVADGVRFALNTRSISKHFAASDPHEIELSGVYDEDGGKLKLELARVTSALLGSVEATGEVTSIGSPDLGVDIALKAGPLKLAGVDRLFLPDEYALAGVGKGRGTIKGQLNKELKWTTDFSVTGLSARAGGYDVAVSGAPVRLASSGTIDLSSSAKPIVKGESSLSLTDLSFSDADGLVMGEGLDLDVKREFTLMPDKETGTYRADFTARALLKGFEFIAGSLYLDFKEREIALSTSGAYLNDGLTIKEGLVKISDIASLGFDGRVDGLSMKKPAPAFDLSLVLKGLSNEKASNVFLKDLVPKLADFDISGTTSMQAKLRGTPSGFSMLGELKVKDTSLVERAAQEAGRPEQAEGAGEHEEADGPKEVVAQTEPEAEADFAEMDGLFTVEELKALEAAMKAEGRTNALGTEKAGEKEGLVKPSTPAPLLSLIDMNASLPFYLTYPNSYKASSRRERAGSLTIGEIKLGEASIKDLKASPLLWENRLSFLDDISIPVFSGAIALHGVVYEDILSPARELSFGVVVSGIRLSEVGDMLGLPPFSGTLTGSIPIVTLSGSRLRTDGLIELRLFSGRIGIRGIEMDNMFSPIASFKSSIEIDRLNLAELTDTFEFGRISGILTGYVQDLVIMDGLPTSFSMQMETIRTRGVPQRIDVKALKKIQVFSSGSSISILDKGIYRFFKEYGYSRMGFSGKLVDDRFSLLGVEEADNKRYIVVGSLTPPRVDVVSYTRDISFAELIKRLKRVQQTE